MDFGFLVGDVEDCLGFLAGDCSVSGDLSAELGLLRLRDLFGEACCRGVAEDEARVVRRVGVDIPRAYCCRAPLNVGVWLKLGAMIRPPCDTLGAMIAFALA